MQDGRVKEQTLTDKEKAVYEEFSVIDGNDDTSWHKYLSVNKHGDVENSIQNLTIILQNDSKLKGIVFNELSDCTKLTVMYLGSARLSIGGTLMTHSCLHILHTATVNSQSEL